MITLNSNLTTGTPPFSYIWKDSSGNILGTQSTLDVTTGDTYTLIVTDAVSSGSTQHVVTEFSGVTESIITKTPNTTILTTSVQSITLDGLASTSNGGTKEYTWYKDNVFIGQGDTIVVNQPGVYKLHVRASITNCSSSSEITITQQVVLPLAVINGPSVIDCNSEAYVEPTPTGTTITEDTRLFIYFDSSGSMNSTLTPLTTAKTDAAYLKGLLLPHYNNDNALYDSMVTIENFQTVRYLEQFTQSLEHGGNIIVLVFQDESDNHYHGYSPNWTINTTRRTSYDTDIFYFRQFLANVPNSFYFRGVLFQVQNASKPEFPQLINAMKDGTGEYSAYHGLSDKNDIMGYEFNVTDGGTPQYYTNLIATALTNLGFTL